MPVLYFINRKSILSYNKTPRLVKIVLFLITFFNVFESKISIPRNNRAMRVGKNQTFR